MMEIIAELFLIIACGVGLTAGAVLLTLGMIGVWIGGDNASDDEDVPHIQAECSTCAMVFDLKFGLDCPRCHSVGVKWARLIKCATCGDTGFVGDMLCETCKPYAQVAQNRLREALDNYVDEQGAAKDVAWLEKLYSL